MSTFNLMRTFHCLKFKFFTHFTSLSLASLLFVRCSFLHSKHNVKSQVVTSSPSILLFKEFSDMSRVIFETENHSLCLSHVWISASWVLSVTNTKEFQIELCIVCKKNFLSAWKCKIQIQSQVRFSDFVYLVSTYVFTLFMRFHHRHTISNFIAAERTEEIAVE